jgi:hypothetical protein
MMYYIMVNGCVTRSILCVLVLVKKKTLDVQSLKADTLIVDGTHARTQVRCDSKSSVWVIGSAQCSQHVFYIVPPRLHT